MNLDTLRSRYRDAILAIAAKHKADNVRVFGSVARGDVGPGSDIDLLVHALPRCSLLDLCAIQNAISDLTGGLPVDVIADDEIRPELAPYILREAVPL